MKYTKHILVGFFVLASLTDLITAVTGANDFRETNPLYTATGNWWLLAIMKLAITGLLVWSAYPKKGFSSERAYYLLILVLIFGGFVYSMGAYTNIEVGHINAEYYATAPQPSNESKTEYYNNFALLYYVMPMLIALIPFILFEWSAPYQKFKKRRIVDKTISRN